MHAPNYLLENRQVSRASWRLQTGQKVGRRPLCGSGCRAGPGGEPGVFGQGRDGLLNGAEEVRSDRRSGRWLIFCLGGHPSPVRVGVMCVELRTPLPLLT